MITRLNEEQISGMSLTSDKWISIGLSTGECDHSAVNALVDDVYKVSGLKPPGIKIWLKSPLEGCIASYLLTQIDQVGSQVVDQVRTQVGDHVEDQVEDQVVDQVWDQVRDQVRDQVWTQVRDHVGAQVIDQVRTQVGAQVRNQVRDHVGAQVIDQVGAQVIDQVRTHVVDQVWDQVRDQVWAQVVDQVVDQVGSHVNGYVWDHVGAQVWTHVMDQVIDQVRNQVGVKVGAQVMDQVWDHVWIYVMTKVRDQVWTQVRDHVGAQVIDQVRTQIGAQVRTQVRDHVGAQVIDQVGAKVLAKVRDEIYECGYGTQDSGWIAFYDYFKCYTNLKGIEKIYPLISLSKEVGWWWPFKDAVIFTEKPEYIYRDDNHRLHHESIMAIRYSDGFGVYFWHGVMVPAEIIEHPENITLEQVLKEDNQEIRRILLERYGWERFLLESESVEEHVDDFGKLVSTNKLAEYLEGEDRIAKFVLVKDPSTDRRYALRVPPNMTTAKESVAWTFSQRAEDYQPIKES